MAPNPSRGRPTVALELAGPADVRVAVYDALGREVAVLADGPLRAGGHRLSLAGGSLPAGVYFVHVSAGESARTARLTVVR